MALGLPHDLVFVLVIVIFLMSVDSKRLFDWLNPPKEADASHGTWGISQCADSIVENCSKKMHFPMTHRGFQGCSIPFFPVRPIVEELSVFLW